MSVVIFGDVFSFPEGSAATGRVHTYAKGLKENGVNVHVICFSSQYDSNDNGIFNGINYYYPFGEKKRNRNFFLRNRKKLNKYFKTYYLLKEINKKDKIVAVSRWTNRLRTHLFAWILAKLFGFKLIIEASEHPLRLYQGSVWKKMKGSVKLYIGSSLSDGILCISRYLIDFYKNHGVPDKKLLLVPSTVDPYLLSQTYQRPVSARYIGYFGSLTFKRDNVDMLIKAFALFTTLHPDIDLVLGGFFPEHSEENLMGLVVELGLIDRVKVLDFLTREEILKYITNADILVMTRSKNLESDASYPSKLTEFLATGKPVISVNVGEISDYLTDKENAFLVEPGDVRGLSEKLEFVYNNYEYALCVSEKGKKLTEEVFNYNYQAKRIIDFINLLYKKK